MMLNTVVLPAPFGPMRPTRSRGPICNESFDSAVRPPNCIVQSRNSRSESIGTWRFLFKQKCGRATLPTKKSLWSRQHQNDQEDRVDEHPIFQEIVDQMRQLNPEETLVNLRNESQRFGQQ